MTRGDLQAVTRKKLAEMARRHRISGWHSMRKEELVDALARVAVPNGRRPDRPPLHSASAAVKRCRLKPARRCDRGGPVRDQLIVEEVDERWLRARWVLSERILDRARVALGTEWPRAVPVLRVYDMTERNGTADRVFVKDEEIREPMDDWYLPVEHTGLSFRVELGYRTPQGTFFVLARSARVRTPQLAGTWGAKRHDGIARDARGTTTAVNGQPPDAPLLARRTNGADAGNEPVFEVDADIVVHGRTHPRAHLTLLGKPLQPHPDGTFAVRMSLEDGRQVIPVVCVSANGCTQRTMVLAIERNTKHLDPMPLDDLA
jgi:uncharacterized protein